MSQTGPRETLVSVIIPCYQQAEFLPDCIESVLGQTCPAQECIVVDDGSPDETAAVVARYGGVRCLRQANGGLAIARNTGFKASKGEYVIFLDADDRLRPDAIEAHLRCFADHPEAGFVVGAIDHIGPNGALRESPRWPLLERNQYEELLKVNHVGNTIAVMFRREVIEELGGFEAACSPVSDYQLLLRAARRFSSAHHAAVVADYRRHTGNMSDNGVLMLRATRDVMRSELSLVRGDARLETALRRGERYWRERFGKVVIREMLRHLRKGKVMQAGVLGMALLHRVRGQLVAIPWKYLKRRLRENYITLRKPEGRPELT